MAILKFTRKIQRVGNSLMISLPLAWSKANKLVPGVRVALEVDEQGRLIIPKNGTE